MNDERQTRRIKLKWAILPPLAVFGVAFIATLCLVQLLVAFSSISGICDPNKLILVWEPGCGRREFVGWFGFSSSAEISWLPSLIIWGAILIALVYGLRRGRNKARKAASEDSPT